MNNHSNPSSNKPTQICYIPQSPGSISGLAKHHYNEQIRDARPSGPSSQRYRRTSSTSTLHQPIDTLNAWYPSLSSLLQGALINTFINEMVVVFPDSFSSSEDQHSTGEVKLPKPAPTDRIEEPDELELIEKRVWGDLSKPTFPVHESRLQDVASRGSSRQGASPKANETHARIGIVSYLLQGQ